MSTLRAALVLPLLLISTATAQRIPGTVIVDVQHFLHQMPPGYPTSAPRTADAL